MIRTMLCANDLTTMLGLANNTSTPENTNGVKTFTHFSKQRDKNLIKSFTVIKITRKYTTIYNMRHCYQNKCLKYQYNEFENNVG